MAHRLRRTRPRWTGFVSHSWRERCSGTGARRQRSPRLSHHNIQILGGTNIRNDGSKTGSSFRRPASPTNRSMAYRSITEPKIVTTLSKTGPSFERRTRHDRQVLRTGAGVQVHGVADVQVTLWCSTYRDGTASTTPPFVDPIRRHPCLGKPRKLASG